MIGRGTFGKVHAANNTAIKIIKYKKDKTMWRTVLRAIKEYSVMKYVHSQLEQRSVKPSLFLVEDNTVKLTMELFPTTLAQAMHQLNTQQKLVALHHIGNSLIALHAAGIAHGDIKPNNICLTHHGQPVFIDFGSAVVSLSTQSTISSSMRVMVTNLSTHGYLPPHKMTVFDTDESVSRMMYALSMGHLAHWFRDLPRHLYRHLKGVYDYSFVARKYDDMFAFALLIVELFCPKVMLKSVVVDADLFDNVKNVINLRMWKALCHTVHAHTSNYSLFYEMMLVAGQAPFTTWTPSLSNLVSVLV